MTWRTISFFVRSSCDDPFLGEQIARIESLNNVDLTITVNDIILTVDTRVEPVKYPSNFPIPGLSDSERFYDREFCRWVLRQSESDICQREVLYSAPSSSSSSESPSGSSNPSNLSQSVSESATALLLEPSYSSWELDKVSDWFRNIIHDASSCKKTGTVTTLNHQSEVADFEPRDDTFNHIKLKLKATSNYVTKREIRPAKTVIEFFAEIGGHLGLFVGVSILTLVELLEFFCKLARRICRARRDAGLVQTI